MRGRGLGWLGVGAAIVLAFGVAFLAPASRPQDKQTVTLDDQIIYGGPNLGDVPKPDCIEIAPVSSPTSMTPGSWTGVSETIFSSILARTGIIPGLTDPDSRAERVFKDADGKVVATFPAAPGFIDNLGDNGSLVLNDGVKDKTTGKVLSTSKRMTFGYFVRVTQTIRGTPITREFYLLMSYDLIDQGTPGTNPAAFEVFVFGPLPTPGMYGGADPKALIPLQDGLAVNGDGVLLGAVPLNIAKQDNYKGDVPKNTPVTPGVEEEGKGCFACHGDRNGGPNSSPAWTMTFGQYQAAYQTRTAKIDCPPPASSVLQNAVLPTNTTTTGGGEGGSVLNGGVLNGVGVNVQAPNQPNTHVEEGGGNSEKEGGHNQTGEGQSHQPASQPGKQP